MWTALGISLSSIGIVVACFGFISIIKPIRKLRIRTRDRAAVVFFVGIIMFITGPFIDLAGNPPPDEEDQPTVEATTQPVPQSVGSASALTITQPEPAAPGRQEKSVVTSAIMSEMTVDEYISHCAKISAAEFKDKCKGKTIIFDGVIRKIVQKDTLEVDVYSSSGRKQGYDLLLSRRLPWNDAWKSYEGRRLTFFGTLKDNAYSDHDIEDGVVVSISPP